jgi:hypothetical protein
MLVIKGEQVPGVTSDSVVLTGLFNSNPNTYLLVNIPWTNVRRLVFEAIEIPTPFQPVGMLYVDSLVYNLTGVPCNTPTGSFANSIKQAYEGQFAQFELASFAGTCVDLQWQVNTGSGFQNISPNDLDFQTGNYNSVSIPNPTLAMNGYQFRVEFNSFCGIGYSDTLTLAVDVCTFAPVITSNDPEDTFCDGDSVTLTATTGDGYYWISY